MRTSFPAATLALVLLTGCSQSPSPSTETTAPAPSSAAPAAPAVHQFGDSAVVIGEGGGQIKVTPTGVLYHRGPYQGVDGPANGWYVAVALTAQAVDRQDDFLAPASGGGWRWKAGGESLWGGEGNSAPWEGSVPTFGDPIAQGETAIGIQTFDVSAKGGTLAYINADETIVEWQIPAKDTGTGLEKVRKQITRFS